MTSKEKTRIEAHRIRTEARKHWGVKAGDKMDVRFIDCWNMAKNGQSLPWENEMEKSFMEKRSCITKALHKDMCLVSQDELDSLILLGQAIYTYKNFSPNRREKKLIDTCYLKTKLVN